LEKWGEEVRNPTTHMPKSSERRVPAIAAATYERRERNVSWGRTTGKPEPIKERGAFGSGKSLKNRENLRKKKKTYLLGKKRGGVNVWI